MANDIQFLLVTLVAIVALAAIVVPYFRKPKPGMPACGNCPSAKVRSKAPSPGAVQSQPLRFVGRATTHGTAQRSHRT